MNSDALAQAFAESLNKRNEESAEVNKDESTQSEDTTQENSEQSVENTENPEGEGESQEGDSSLTTNETEAQATETTDEQPPATKQKEEEEGYREPQEEEQTETEDDGKQAYDVEKVQEWLRSEEGVLWSEDLDEYDVSDVGDDAQEMVLMSYIEQGLTYEEANDALRDDYMELFDEDADKDSREYRKEKRKFLVEAREQLQKLKQRKSEIEFPFSNPSSEGGEESRDKWVKEYQEQQKQTLEKQQAEVIANLETVADNILPKYDKVSFDYGDGLSFDVEMTGELRKQAREDITNPYFAEVIGSIVNPNEKPTEQAEKEIMQTWLAIRNPKLLIELGAKVASSKSNKDFVDSNLKHKDKATQKSASGDSPVEITGNDMASHFARALLNKS